MSETIYNIYRVKPGTNYVQSAVQIGVMESSLGELDLGENDFITTQELSTQLLNGKGLYLNEYDPEQVDKSQNVTSADLAKQYIPVLISQIRANAYDMLTSPEFIEKFGDDFNARFGFALWVEAGMPQDSQVAAIANGKALWQTWKQGVTYLQAQIAEKLTYINAEGRSYADLLLYSTALTVPVIPQA